MSTSFGRRLKDILGARPRPTERLAIPAALGASDAELVRLAADAAADDRVRQRALTVLYGGQRLV